MEEKPWRKKNWWVSPWNFIEEVTKDFTPPKKVKVHDCTARDGEQQAGIVFSSDDKIRMLEKSASLGVHRIEPAMPSVSPEDVALTKEIVKRKLGPKVSVVCRAVADEIKQAADCGVDCITVGVNTGEPIIEYGFRWPFERVIETAIKATLVAKEQGLYTILFPTDGCRRDLNQYFTLIESVIRDGHADSVVVVDTFGALTPQAASYVVRKLRERITIPVEIHFHNHSGLALANTIAGVLSGAEVFHGAFTGIGEGQGGLVLEEAMVALIALYGIDTGVKYEKLYEMSNLVREIAGTTPCRPIFDERGYTIETGTAVHVFKNSWKEHPTVSFAIDNKFIGHPGPTVLLGKKSCIDGVEIWADKLGISLSEEEGREVLKQVKSLAIKLKRAITEKEFIDITKNVKGKS